MARGGYVLREAEGEAEVVLMGTGSELALAVEAADELTAAGHRVRVVSMPSVDVFLAQDESYRRQVLGPEGLPRVAVEAGAPLGWYTLVGQRGTVLGLEGFGASAPAAEVYRHFGLTAAAVAEAARRLLEG